MITYTLLAEEGIIIIEPAGLIRQSDFGELTKDMDNHLRQKGMLRGLIIHSESFPRWDDFGAFLKDMQFVFGYQRKIKRVASVTDSRLFMVVHGIARHVLFPEIKHFYYGELEAAKKWIQEAR